VGSIPTVSAMFTKFLEENGIEAYRDQASSTYTFELPSGISIRVTEEFLIYCDDPVKMLDYAITRGSVNG
jgi:hypothetical protein